MPSSRVRPIYLLSETNEKTANKIVPIGDRLLLYKSKDIYRKFIIPNAKRKIPSDTFLIFFYMHGPKDALD